MNSAQVCKNVRKNLVRLSCALGAVILVASLAAGVAQAQVPADIEAGLVKIGHVVDPACTAKLYRSLMPANDVNSNVTPLYPGITLARDQSFGPDPKDVVDIFTADKGGGNRPVLIYIPGGAGNKIEIQDREANAFYDNIGRWATKNGMVGVLMQRHGGAGGDFYAGAKDISAMLQWVEVHIGQYKGNPDRMFLWAQSAGNGPTGIYIGHPEIYGPKGVGVKGVIFMSGQFSILRPDGTNPVPQAAGGAGGRGAAGAAGGATAAGAGGAPGAAAGAGGGGGGGRGAAAAASPCGVPGGNGGTEGALPGRAPGQPGGPNVAAAAGAGGGGGGGRGAGPQLSQEELIKRSSLPALETGRVKVLLASGELDSANNVGPDGGPSPFNKALHDELCKLGKDHCPMLLFEKGESHMSEVFSIDTADTTVSGPVLKWIKSVK